VIQMLGKNNMGSHVLIILVIDDISMIFTWDVKNHFIKIMSARFLLCKVAVSLFLFPVWFRNNSWSSFHIQQERGIKYHLLKEELHSTICKMGR
jgi:hypothetical protein